jgi:hypothetical protein
MGETRNEVSCTREVEDHPAGGEIPSAGPANSGQGGITSTAFYRWCDRYQAFSEAGLEDRTSGPGRVWNRIPDNIRQRIVEMALDEPELSPRELAVKFIDEKAIFFRGRRLPATQGP